MIFALFQICLTFVIFYSFYSKYNVPDEEYDIEIKDPDPWRYDKVNNAGLTIPHELDYDDFDDETAKAIRELHGSVIDDRFVVGKPLGSPGFTGIVLGGFDLLTAEEVAIKFAERDKFFSLRKEHENYVYIGADDPKIVEHGISNIIHYGEFGEYKVLVLKKFGPTIRDMRNKRKRPLTMKTMALVALQVLDILEYIHSKGFVYNDIKPENICIGNSKETENKIYLVDFAFSEPYLDEIGKPMPRYELDELNGTPEYMGRGPLHGLSQVRKDDFISLGIVIMELSGVYIPWFDLDLEDVDIWQSMEMVLEQWDMYSLQSCYEGSEYSQFFREYFDYLDTLEAVDEPDYNTLRKLLKSLVTEKDIKRRDLGFLEGLENKIDL